MVQCGRNFQVWLSKLSRSLPVASTIDEAIAKQAGVQISVHGPLQASGTGHKRFQRSRVIEAQWVVKSLLQLLVNLRVLPNLG